MTTGKVDNMAIKIIIFLLGLLVGLGTAYATTITDVRENKVKLEIMTTAIQKNADNIQITLDLVKAVVNQNSMLINSVVQQKRIP